MPLLALSGGVLSFAVILVSLGAYLDIAAISMPAVLLATLSVIPLVAGLKRLLWPDVTALSSKDGILG